MEGLIRDRIVRGLIDNTVRELLLREKDLTLTKALEIVRASELATKEMSKLIQKSSLNVDAVQTTLSNQKYRSTPFPKPCAGPGPA